MFEGASITPSHSCHSALTHIQLPYLTLSQGYVTFIPNVAYLNPSTLSFHHQNSPFSRPLRLGLISLSRVYTDVFVMLSLVFVYLLSGFFPVSSLPSFPQGSGYESRGLVDITLVPYGAMLSQGQGEAH